jgi:hypothetical protein
MVLKANRSSQRIVDQSKLNSLWQKYSTQPIGGTGKSEFSLLWSTSHRSNLSACTTTWTCRTTQLLLPSTIPYQQQQRTTMAARLLSVDCLLWTGAFSMNLLPSACSLYHRDDVIFFNNSSKGRPNSNNNIIAMWPVLSSL